jgi:hypothetical protein
MQALGLAVLVLVSTPALGRASRLSQVRVGTHEDRTRIVLELDAPAAYRVLPRAPGQGQEIRLSIEARSAARTVVSRSPLVRSVRVEPSGSSSTVSVALAQPGIELSETILSDPPRIVLDLSSPAAAARAPVVAPKPEPKAVAKAPATVPKPEPKPEPAIAEAVAVPRSVSAAPIEAAKPADAKPEPEMAKAPSLSDPLPKDLDTDPVKPASVPPLVQPLPGAAPAAPIAQAAPKPTAPAPPAAAPVPRPAPSPATPAPPEVSGGSTPPPSGPGEVVVRRGNSFATPGSEALRKAAQESDEAAGSDSLLASPIGLAAIGAAVLALLGLVVVRRRRRAEEDDPLYTVMSAEDAGAEPDGWGAIRAEQEREEQQRVAAPRSWDVREEVALAEPAPASYETKEIGAREGIEPLSLGRGLLGEPSSSIFEAGSSSPGRTGTGSGLHSADPSRMAPELPGRVAELERRLEQLVEARERLERQVAAQTEELRVQRAAIARTQRVVRSMAKPEDLATEPVPRAPQN